MRARDALRHAQGRESCRTAPPCGRRASLISYHFIAASQKTHAIVEEMLHGYQTLTFLLS